MLANTFTIIFIFLILVTFNELVASYDNQQLIALINSIISILLLIPITYPRSIIIKPSLNFIHSKFNNWEPIVILIIAIITILIFISFITYKIELKHRRISKKEFPKLLNNYFLKKKYDNVKTSSSYLYLFNPDKSNNIHISYLDYILAPKPRLKRHKLCVKIWNKLLRK